MLDDTDDLAKTWSALVLLQRGYWNAGAVAGLEQSDPRLLEEQERTDSFTEAIALAAELLITEAAISQGVRLIYRLDLDAPPTTAPFLNRRLATRTGPDKTLGRPRAPFVQSTAVSLFNGQQVTATLDGTSGRSTVQLDVLAANGTALAIFGWPSEVERWPLTGVASELMAMLSRTAYAVLIASYVDDGRLPPRLLGPVIGRLARGDMEASTLSWLTIGLRRRPHCQPFVTSLLQAIADQTDVVRAMLDRPARFALGLWSHPRIESIRVASPRPALDLTICYGWMGADGEQVVSRAHLGRGSRVLLEAAARASLLYSVSGAELPPLDAATLENLAAFEDFVRRVEATPSLVTDVVALLWTGLPLSPDIPGLLVQAISQWSDDQVAIAVEGVEDFLSDRGWIETAEENAGTRDRPGLIRSLKAALLVDGNSLGEQSIQ